MKIDFEEMAIKILGVTTVVMVFGLFLMLSCAIFTHKSKEAILSGKEKIIVATTFNIFIIITSKSYII
jgi:hypothetical protein